MNIRDACIAYPCAEKREEGSGFCGEHHKTHEESLWAKAWRLYQKEVARVGVKKAIWTPPDPELTTDAA